MELLLEKFYNEPMNPPTESMNVPKKKRLKYKKLEILLRASYKLSILKKKNRSNVNNPE